MNLILINIGQTLNYILELTIILYILKNILFITMSTSKIRQYLSLAFMLAWGIYTYFSNTPLPETFIIFPIVLLLFKESLFIIIFIVTILTLAINIINSICFYTLCLAIHITYNNKLLHILIILLSLVIMLTSIAMLKSKINIDINTFKKIKTKNLTLILPVIFVDFFLSGVSCLLFYQNINYIGRRLLMLAIYIMIILSIIILVLYFRISHIHSELEQIDNLKSKMLSLEEQYYKDLQNKNMDLRAFKHDYNYHITAMQALAQNNNFEDLKIYVEKLTQIKANVYFISTNNVIADAIINYFYENLPKNTEFKIDGKFLENTFVSNDDLCVIISNLLKNAYESICLITPTDQISDKNNKQQTDKHIYVSLYNDENNITMYIENTCTSLPNQSGTNFFTLKSDSINHGFGLKNVNNTIKKYNGKLELKSEKNTFCTYVFLHNII